MNETGRAAFAGIDVFWIVLGFIGAALGVSSMPPMNKRQMFTAVVSGIVAAAFAPQWAAHYYAKIFSEPIPAFMNNTVAFVFGVGGMFIVPGVIVVFRSAKENPFGVIDWLIGLVSFMRGKTPSPPPAPPSQEPKRETPQ